MKVLKFGGSSVSCAEDFRNAAEIISLNKGEELVIVLSASGKTTRKLLDLYNYFQNGETTSAEKVLNEIKNHHLKIASSIIFDINIFSETNRKLLEIFGELKRELLLTAACGGNNKIKARILSFGELFSTLIMSSYLEYLNLRCKLFDSREIIKTNSGFLNASADLIQTERNASEKILPFLKKGSIAVLQGFIGSNKNNETTTLGFEGSDYTATLIGNVLNADEIYNWTDVDGILTADPRLMQNPSVIPSMTYEEAEEIAVAGAKVLHPRSVNPASQKNIPVFIKNSKHPYKSGTCINYGGDSTYPVKSIVVQFNFTPDDDNFILYGNGDNLDSISRGAVMTLIGKGIRNDVKVNRMLRSIMNGKADISIFSYSNNNLSMIIDESDIFDVMQKIHSEMIVNVRRAYQRNLRDYSYSYNYR